MVVTPPSVSTFRGRCFEEEKLNRARVLVLNFYGDKRTDKGNSLRMRKQEDISLCYIRKQGNLEPLNKLRFWSRFNIFVGMMNDKCLNV